MVAQAEISHLHGQLAQALAIQTRAFAYGHVAGIERLSAHLLNDSGKDLRALDKRFFNLQIAACCHVDTFGCEEMPDAFAGVLLFPSTNEDPALAP